MRDVEHEFGEFYPTVTVDGETYTFEDYKALPKHERLALKDRVVKLTQKAAAKERMERERCAAPIIADFKEKQEEVRAQMKNQKKSSTRYLDLVRKLDQLRRQKALAIQDACAHVESDGYTYPAAVDDIFNVWETRVEDDWERLERLLKNHDWYYDYSDDMRVWLRGQENADAIKKLVAKLGPKAKKLYDKYAPKSSD